MVAVVRKAFFFWPIVAISVMTGMLAGSLYYVAAGNGPLPLVCELSVAILFGFLLALKIGWWLGGDAFDRRDR